MSASVQSCSHAISIEVQTVTQNKTSPMFLLNPRTIFATNIFKSKLNSPA